MMLAVAGVSCQKQGSEANGITSSAPVNFSVEFPETETKVEFDAATGQPVWTGGEAAKVIVGHLKTTTSKASGLQLKLPSVSDGVFSGDLNFTGDFTTDDVRAIVIPYENNAYFRYRNSYNRIYVDFPAAQTQTKAGKLEPQYFPLYAKVSYADLTSGNKIQLKAAGTLLYFNVYGTPPGASGDEILKSITVNVASGAVTGPAEIVYDSETAYYNGTKTGKVSLSEPLVINGRSKEDGIKVWLSVCGPARTIESIAIETDKAVYTKVVNYAYTGKSTSAKKVVINQIGLNMSKVGWTRNPESDAGPVYITDPYSSAMHYSTGRLRTTTAAMQSFDFDSETGDIYYSQLNNNFRAYISHGPRNSTVQPPMMTLNFTGHVSNFTLECASDGKRYIWVDNFSSKNESGAYWGSPVVSRILYQEGTTLNAWECTDNYYFGEKNISVAVDLEGDMMTVLGISSGDCKTYRLSELQALPVEDITLDPVTYGGEPKAEIAETTKAHTIKARDCTGVTPLGQFNIPREKNADGSNVSWQGFDIHNGLVYQAQGMGYIDTPSFGMVQVRGIDGSVVVPLTTIKAIEDKEVLNAVGLTDTGYMEPEGIKVRNGKLYIGFANKNSEDIRMGTIFRYSLDVVPSEP